MKSAHFLNLTLRVKAKFWPSKILAWVQKVQFICSSTGKAGETLQNTTSSLEANAHLHHE